MPAISVPEKEKASPEGGAEGGSYHQATVLPPGNDSPSLPYVLDKYIEHPSAKEVNGLSYAPKLLHRYAEKNKGGFWTRLKNWMGIDFSLDSVISYYSCFRLLGYIAQIGYSPLNSYLYDNSRYIQKGSNEEKPKGAEPLRRGYFKSYLNKAEGIVFTSLAAGAFVLEKNDLEREASLAVSAEQGVGRHMVGIPQLLASNNPIIASAVRRTLWKGGSRTAAGGSFFLGLVPGVIGNSIIITLERTAFYRPCAYDILQKAINDVQFNEIGQHGKSDFVNNLVRVLQAEQYDHGRTQFSRRQIEGIRPVLEEIADDVIEKRFGFAGMLHIMGGGVLDLDDPLQSMANYYHVRQVGVEGVAKEAREARSKGLPTPTTVIYQQGVDARKLQDSGRVAESATEAALKKYRGSLSARGPALAVPGGEVGDPRGNSGGAYVF